jgi:hypothetical protein
MIYMVFLLFFSSTSFAASATATGVTTVYKDAAGVTRVAEVMTKMNSVTYGVKYALQRVAISPISMGKMAVRAVAGPFGAAVIAAMALRSWYWDGENFVQRAPSIDPSDLEIVTGQLHCSALSTGSYKVSGGFIFFRGCISASSLPSVWSVVSYCAVECDGGTAYSSLIRKPYSADPFPDLDNPDRVVSIPEVGQQIFDSVDAGTSSPSLPIDIANDNVSTGHYSDDWPELQTHLSDLTSKLSLQDDPNNSENHFTDTEENSFRDVDDKQQLDSTDFDIPVGCDLLPQICDIYNFLTGDVPSDLGAAVAGVDTQVIDLPTISTTDGFSALASASCPAPASFEAMGRNFDLSYEPLCSLVSSLRPLIISLTLISAVSIVIIGGSNG